MGSWFWVMSSCFWHAAGAAGREGEAEDLHCTGPTPLDRLPACTFQTLEHAGASGRHNSAGMPGMGSV